MMQNSKRVTIFEDEKMFMWIEEVCQIIQIDGLSGTMILADTYWIQMCRDGLKPQEAVDKAVEDKMIIRDDGIYKLTNLAISITGTRTFDNYKVMVDWCDELIPGLHNIKIWSGGAKGSDEMAERYARERGYPFEAIHAEWETTKPRKAAGPIRNTKLAQTVDCGIVFWDGKSGGTADYIGKMIIKEKPLAVIDYSRNKLTVYNDDAFKGMDFIE